MTRSGLVAKLVLDTNIYIQALRDDGARERLADWQRRMAPSVYQHSVVVAEVLVGARDERTMRRWHALLMAPAERLGRVFTPSPSAWREAARIVVRLVQAKRLSPGGVKPSFFNDCLIAASALESGFTLITHNLDDFRRIGRVVPGLSFRALDPV